MTLQPITTRLALSGALLVAGMTALLVSAHLGAVHLGAGDMAIVFGRGEAGIVMDIGARTCPPNCGIDINWKPLRG